MSVNHGILAGLDGERRASGEPSSDGRVVREYSADGSECQIVFSRCADHDVEDVIREELSLARSGGYALEWKVYGHDTPPDLADRLLAAGFVPDEAESVLVLPVTEAALAAFGSSAYEIRRVHDEAGLADYAEISREIGRRNVEEEKQQLALALRDTPEALSVHIAYLDGEPVACGRLHLRAGSDFAELAGGRTRTTHRRQGLFTALVAARLEEALERNRTHVFVDALPTSEPILRKRGFRFVTRTQPFLYEPTA